MPFGIRSKGDKWEVYNKDTGSVKGTHNSNAKAQRQLRALYENVSDVKRTGSLGSERGKRKGGDK